MFNERFINKNMAVRKKIVCFWLEAIQYICFFIVCLYLYCHWRYNYQMVNGWHSINWLNLPCVYALCLCYPRTGSPSTNVLLVFVFNELRLGWISSVIYADFVKATQMLVSLDCNIDRHHFDDIGGIVDHHIFC